MPFGKVVAIMDLKEFAYKMAIDRVEPLRKEGIKGDEPIDHIRELRMNFYIPLESIEGDKPLDRTYKLIEDLRDDAMMMKWIK